MDRKLRGNLLLLLTAFIWGSAFVAQRVGMDYIGPFTFNGVRMIIGGFVLIPLILFFNRNSAKETSEVSEDQKKKDRTFLLKGGIFCGLAIFIGSSLQQMGLVYTTAGKAGFITAMYIVLVPILGLFLGKKVRKLVWFCVLLAAAGLYMLCIKEGFSVSKGDLFMLLCAFAFGIHILVIDYFSPKVDAVKLSCIQFFVCGLLSLFPMFAWESPTFSSIITAWLPLLYTGVLSCGVGFTLQVIAQKDTDPTIASLLMSMEAVFAVLMGIIILNEMFSIREFIGCVLMFAAIILAQLPEKPGLPSS